MKDQKIARAILEYMNGKRYTPMGQIALFNKLGFPKELHPTCKEIIKSLIDEGKIHLQKKQLYIKKEETEIEGTIRIHARGFGFVVPDDRKAFPQDIFIPKSFIENAVDSDHVRVEIFEKKEPNSKGPEGRVVEILDRGRKFLVGIIVDFEESYSDKKKRQDAIAFVPLLGSSKSVRIPHCPKDIRVGDRVHLKVIEWDDCTICSIQKKLGSIENAKADIPIAILEYGIRAQFSNEVVKEAKAFGTRVKESEIKQRVDLTHQACCTIDPTTAKDYDDALFVQKHEDGYELWVHIADVAHYVKLGSHLDTEAKERGNSTYFPGLCVPMLPEELSNNLCSLKANVKRLAQTVQIRFNLKGDILNTQIYRSVIKSRKRFTYEEAKEILDGKKRSPHKANLQTMVELCLLLKDQRKARGSVDLSLPELSLEIDKEGMPVNYHLIEYDITHQMVEEFMLKANECVALSLTSQGKPAVFRIHETPSDENMQDFYALARSFGFHLSPQPTPQEISQLFDAARDTPHAKQLSVGFIRSMKLAFYSENNVGHFGLALQNYCHFTSPIRRYSDLVVQRLLFDEPQSDDLFTIAQNCSERERLSFKAESSVLTLKKLRLLKEVAKKRDSLRFPATITKVRPFGFFFDIDLFMIEGFIHISRIGNDYYNFYADQGVLIGDHTRETFKNGQRIDVELLQVDLIMQTTEFRLLRPHGRSHKRSKGKNQKS